MPNGGSDCCGSCWFNARNKGEAGFDHADDPDPNYCTIRNIEIAIPFWTYCGNHPHRRPYKDLIPIGPVYTAAEEGGRTIWIASPDTEQIRLHLLDLLRLIRELPEEEYPLGIYSDELVVWQLGEFQETRAIADLRRIEAFAVDKSTDCFERTRKSLVTAAKDALSKMDRATT